MTPTGPAQSVPPRVIDIHSHVLPGLDDGAADLEESLEILRTMARDGVRVVVATPHVREDYPTTPEQMHDALELVRVAVEAEELQVDVLPGAEIALDALAWLSGEEREAFGLGGNPHLLLVETPYHGWSAAMESTVHGLVAAGVTPVIAHPERNPVVQQHPELLATLVREGAAVQLTAASVDGRLGQRAAAVSRDLLARGLAHVVASDAHGPAVRDAGLASVASALGDPVLSHWLTSAMPAALLAGAARPERPPLRERGRGLRARLQRRR